MEMNTTLVQFVFQSIQDGIGVVDKNYTILQVNQAMNQLYRHRLPLEGKTCFQVFQNRDAPCAFCHMQQGFQVGKIVEEVFRPPGTDVEWVEIHSYPLKGTERDKIMGTLKLVLDISERKKKEAACLEQETIILNSISDTIVFYDRKMRIKWMNKQAENLAGKNLQDLQGAYCYQTWFDRDTICEGCPMERVLKEGRPSEGEVVISAEDTLLVKGYPVFDEENHLVGFIELGLDITEKKKMENYLKDNKYKLEKIHETALQMSRSRKEEEIYQLIVEAAAEILHFNHYIFYLIEENSLVVKLSTVETLSHSIPINKGVVGETYGLGQAILIEDTQKKDGLTDTEALYGSLLSVPVSNRGIIQLFQPEKKGFHQEDIHLVEMITTHAHEALKSIQSGTRLQHLSLHDNLTQLYNRSYLEEKINGFDHEGYLPISIIMADINGLKLVNDTYGYGKGDLLLITAAKILKRSCRGDDMITRWGGDEFIIFLTNTSRADAQIICNRILEECREVTVEGIPLQIALGSATKKEMHQDIYGVFKEAEDLMYKQKLTENRSTRGKIISTLLKTLGEKSDETEEHAWRMQKMAIDIGDKIGLPPEELDRLSLLLTLHDIGKIAISEEILTKPGRLTEEEWEIIKRHPEVGSRIASSSEDFAHVAEEILSHHERWDGYGYPRGLKEKEIPILARVTSIVDAFDVMTNNRSYKEAITKEEAIKEMQVCAGSQFDPHLVGIFINMVKKKTS